MVAPVELILSERETGAASNPLYNFERQLKDKFPMSRLDGVKDMSAPAEPPQDDPPEPEREDRRAVYGGGYDHLQQQQHQQPGRHSAGERPAYLIRWNRFEEQVCSAFAELFCSDHFVDVTLACEGELMKAHKIVLAMSSPFFRRIFQETPCKHPVVIIKGISPKTLRSILRYLYLGEVILNKDDINNFMDAADYLNICGVMANLYSCDISSTTTAANVQRARSESESDSAKFAEATATQKEKNEDSRVRESQLTEQETGTIGSESAVIKYHCVKSRWTRRYSNTSFHGSPTTSPPVGLEHKRSASAGEIESMTESADTLPVTDTLFEKSKTATEPVVDGPSDTDMTAVTDEERYDDCTIVDDTSDSRRRKVIQRAYRKDYVNFDDSSDTQLEDWRVHSSQSGSTKVTGHSAGRRPQPYAIGTKDFSHPLQVAVDSHSQSLFGGASSTSAGPERLQPKSHQLYSSPHSLPSQRSMYRSEDDTEFAASSSSFPLTLLASQTAEDKLRQRLPNETSTSSPSTSAYRSHHDYPSRSHLSLLSTHTWSFQDGRARTHFSGTSGSEVTEPRFRPEPTEGGAFTSITGAKDFLQHSTHLRSTQKPHSFSSSSELSVPVSQQYALGFLPHLRSPSSSTSSSASATRPKTKAIRSSQVPQSSRYTAAEVDQMVDAVANYPGNIVPCTLCQKFVKRERLRAHIHECHLLTGEKIICPHCGIALKSKGSFRVHIWRHKRGALPTRGSMTDFGKGPSTSSGPASH